MEILTETVIDFVFIHLFILTLFYDAVSSSDCVAGDDRIINQ
jgi:hypothetical protein